VTHDDSGSSPTPIEAGWEPEPERPPITDRLGGGPIAWFRAVPARFFAWLGGVVFVGGWALSVYIAWFSDRGAGGSTPASYQLQVFLGNGLQATIAAGILWAVAVFLWVRVLPALPDEPV
jgi:hypothetical protein